MIIHRHFWKNIPIFALRHLKIRGKMEILLTIVIIAGETSHRTPIDDVILPLIEVAEISRYEVLNRVKSRTIDGGLVIRGCHADVVCRDT